MLRNRRTVHVRVTRAIAVSTLAFTSTLAAAPGSAQSVDTRGTAEVSVPRANFRADCSMSAEVVATLTEGEEVEVLGTAGSWYRVRHSESGIEGCMHRTVLGTVTMLSEEELSEEEAERRAREAEWAARRARGEKRVTGYLDLNVGYGSPGEDRLNTEGSLFMQDANGNLVTIPNSHFADEYEYGGDLAYGLAGGFLVKLYQGGSVGGGASLTRATYSVDLFSVSSTPHPIFQQIIVSDDISTDGPDRTETALHLHAVYAPPTPDVWRVRVFIGPTIFRVDLPVSDGFLVRYPTNPPRREVVSVEFGEHEETVVGAHAGADVAYFFSRAFGIGASAIFSRATEEFEFSPPDAPSGEQIVEEVTLGGLAAMVGVRFRF